MYLIVVAIALVIGSTTAGPAQWQNSEEDEYDDFERSMEEQCINMMIDSIASCYTPWHMDGRLTKGGRHSNNLGRSEVIVLEKLQKVGLDWLPRFKQAFKKAKNEISEESEYEESEGSEESECEESGSVESDEYEWVFSGEMGSFINRQFCYARTMLEGMECLAYHAGSNIDHVNPYHFYDLKKMLNIKKEMFAKRGESANKIMKIMK